MMQIPISNPASTQEGIKAAVITITNLQNDLRYVLHLHREGQRSFAKQAQTVKNHAKLQPKEAKIILFRA